MGFKVNINTDSIMAKILEKTKNSINQCPQCWGEIKNMICLDCWVKIKIKIK